MFIGLDFGTSNTSAAVFDGNEIRFIPLDPSNQEDINILSSMVYVTKAQDRFYGQRAISEYIERMAGRPVRFKREEFGDVEMFFGDLSYVAKAHYMVEENMPGRLFQYLKKYAGDDFETNVFGTLYKPHELITFILIHIKETTEQYLQKDVEGVILGRPVKYSEDEEKNKASIHNLQHACRAAGFKYVEFQYEPVAAAYNYLLHAKDNENILIFDFGGGTFDVTIVNVQHGRSDVLGLGGVPVGGSDFDRAIMYQKITPYFGKGRRVEGRIIPNNAYLELMNWQTIVQLNKDRRFLKSLDRWLFYADDPRPFRALQRLVKENHGFSIFQEIERAKKALSENAHAVVHYNVAEVFKNEGEININQSISRDEFQGLLVKFSNKVFGAIDETLKAANLRYSDVDRVIRVGGSSRIPFFYQRLIQKFGEDKLLMKDEFKNVAAGLAVDAFYKSERLA